jgi:hypothetical protein
MIAKIAVENGAPASPGDTVIVLDVMKMKDAAIVHGAQGRSGDRASRACRCDGDVQCGALRDEGHLMPF